jgi:hypothetical protein
VSAADRIALAHPAVLPGAVLCHRQDEILALVDGRRTPRDLAFALGQGLYETMLQLTRMRASNTVVISSRGQAHTPPEPAYPTSDDEERDETAGGLPRRRRDRAGSSRAGETSRRSFAANIRMLRPRSGGESPDETS